MATTYYPYAKTVAPALDQLKADIEASAMTSGGKADYVGANWNGDAEEMKAKFSNALVPGDETILDALVAALPNAPAAKGALLMRFYKAKKYTALKTTTSGTWQDVLTVALKTGWIEEGWYRLAVVYQWYYTNAQSDFEARVMLDGTSQLFLHKQEPKDPGTDQRHVIDYFRDYQITADGEYEIMLQFRSGNGSAEAGIRNARVEFFEVPE